MPSGALRAALQLLVPPTVSAKLMISEGVELRRICKGSFGVLYAGRITRIVRAGDRRVKHVRGPCRDRRDVAEEGRGSRIVRVAVDLGGWTARGSVNAVGWI